MTTRQTATSDFDLLVVGAGSGGVATARRAALHGARVALIEQARVGGTCVLRGCEPKKLLMYAAQFGDSLRDATAYGWNLASTPSFSMSAWQAAKTQETDRLEQVYRNLLSTSGVEVINGRAVLIAPGQLQVGTRILRGEHIVLATGSAPARGTIEGLHQCPTSDDLLDLSELPDQAAVVGGGYIAVEFASMLCRLGVQVTLLYRDVLPLRGFDEDLRTRAASALAAVGVTLLPKCAPQRVTRAASGWQLELPDGRTLTVPWVLNATGRRPNTEGLGLENVGIALDSTGAVPVDSQRRTTVSSIYAIGDVTNIVNLTPVAIAEGRALADNLFAQGAPLTQLAHIPTAVFTIPPLATVGVNEQEAATSGIACRVYEADFRPMRVTISGGSERCYMKMLVEDPSDKVIGLHMIGADAPEIMQSLAVAVTAGATKADFDRTLAVHPTSAEEWVLLRQPTRRLASR